MKQTEEQQKEKAIHYVTKLISDMKIQLFVTKAEEDETDLPAPAVMPIYDMDVTGLENVLSILKGEAEA